MTDLRVASALAACLFLLISCTGGENPLEEATTQAILVGDWEGAIAQGERWAAEDPKNPVAHYLLNMAFTYTDKRDRAKAELAKAFASRADLSKVDKWTAALLEAHPQSPYAFLLRGIVQEVSGRNAEAVRSYQQATECDPGFALAHASLGNLYLSSRRLDKAQDAYRAMLAIDPEDASVHVHLGTVHIMRGDIDSAILSFERACEMDASDVIAHYNLGNAYLERGAKAKAIAAFVRVAQLDPTGEVGNDARAQVARLSR